MNKEQLNHYIKEYLKNNLQIDVSSSYGYDNIGMTHKITLSLDNEVIAETSFDSGEP